MTKIFGFDSPPSKESSSNLKAVMTWAKGVDQRMVAYNENLANLIASVDALVFLLIEAELITEEEYTTVRGLKLAEMLALLKPDPSDIITPRTGIIAPS